MSPADIGSLAADGAAGTGASVGAVLTMVGWILLWIVAGLLGLLLLLLLLPISARAAGHIDDESLHGYLAMRWAWGFLTFRAEPGEGVTVRLLGLRLRRLRGRSPSRKAAARRQRAAKRGGVAGFRALLTHRRTLWRLLKRSGRALHLRLRLVGVVGTGDPADTAHVTQGINAVAGLLGAEQVRVAPDYLEERLELEGLASAWVWPMQLIGIALSAILRKETRRALRDVRGRR